MKEKIQLEIRRPDKAPVVSSIEPGIYRVGSAPDNRMVLPGARVSPSHAVLSLNQRGCWVEDLHSESGTFVDGVRVSDRATFKLGQQIAIGPYVLIPSEDGHASASPPQPGAAVTATPPFPPASASPAAPPARDRPAPKGMPAQPAPASAAAQGVVFGTAQAQAPAALPPAERRQYIKKQIHDELVKRLNLKRLTVSKVGEEDLHKRVRATLREIVTEIAAKLPPGVEHEALVNEIYDEAVGLGPLETLLADQDITEIMVNGPNRVYIEKKGKLTRTSLAFLNESSVLAIIERIVSPLGRRIDESQPYVDARLKDGSRVNAIIHPLSLVGPCLTIRKFSKDPYKDLDLIGFDTMSPGMAEFMRACVITRKNIVISGGTGTGKTTLLNVLGNYLPGDDRIITIEDAAELRLNQEHIVSLEARPANIEGKGAISIRDLVRNSLRMRPDRIVVGECRGGEALDMLQAMNTGHDGSLTTVHANSPRDVISRLETMVLMSGMELPVRAIREQIASAIDVIIHLARLHDGSRKIVEISEVVGLESEVITMQDIFKYRPTGVDENNKQLGYFTASGSVPTFVEEFKSRGVSLSPSVFTPRRN